MAAFDPPGLDEPSLPAVARLRPYRRKRSAAAAVSDRAVRAGTPYSAMVEIADRCNEACVHCYQVQGQKGELDTREWKRVFDELAALGVVFLTISGGEPTLRKDFLELVAHARQLRFAVKIYSNALNIDQALARELGRLAVQEVQISLYSHRAEIHDGITRVPGSFERVVTATRDLRAARVKVLLKSPLMRQNAADYSAYIDFVSSLGADYALDPKLSPREDGDLAPTELGIDKQTYLSLLKDPRFGGERKRSQPLVREHPCGACKGNVHVEANGELRPCTQWQVPTGHVLETSLRDAWYDDPTAASIRALTWDSLPDCRRCDLRDHCQRCFADAQRYVGNPLSPYPKACRSARWQYEHQAGVMPQIDSPKGYCAVEPIGPFLRVGEHQFTLEAAASHAPLPDATRAGSMGPEPEAAHVLDRLRPASTGQLVQIRRRPSRSL